MTLVEIEYSASALSRPIGKESACEEREKHKCLIRTLEHENVIAASDQMVELE